MSTVAVTGSSSVTHVYPRDELRTCKWCPNLFSTDLEKYWYPWPRGYDQALTEAEALCLDCTKTVLMKKLTYEVPSNRCAAN